MGSIGTNEESSRSRQAFFQIPHPLCSHHAADALQDLRMPPSRSSETTISSEVKRGPSAPSTDSKSIPWGALVHNPAWARKSPTLDGFNA